ncbi:hypothetical protein ADIWIN_2243 [Winogradskyella psychrotolerans RS-3]|uniref:Uncharacterized protein n=2 Tax=Winogradskyella TaxID=286104 RepID=S7VRZ8_9FLAO|nr:hypothetical protein [Winogradskyella psychrotolerans]EPR72771.1 hypothetical protein ADIWIN_2243 [Winogradskyella psychrotolerans RS-3]
MKPLFGFGIAIGIVLGGIYLLNTKDTLLAKIIGIACIVFFGGLMIWAIFKKIQQNKQKK